MPACHEFYGAAMSPKSLVADITCALHQDPKVRMRVGDRVTVGVARAELPEIVVAEVSSDNQGQRVVLTCRGRTLREAEQVGNAAIGALRAYRSMNKEFRFVAVQDRSGYDSATAAFRRVFQLKLEPAIKLARAER